jgi:hypothetical protein
MTTSVEPSLRRRHGCDHDHCQRYRESGLALVRGDDNHLGNFWAFHHIVRPTMLEAWWQEDVAACLMPFYLNSRRANARVILEARPQHGIRAVRDFLV